MTCALGLHDTTGNYVDREVETVFTEDMTQNPTTESHPYQVGRVVYTTLDEAIAKAQAAQDAYPDWKAHVIDRRTMTQAWPNCTGTSYPINPDAPDEGTDIRHDGECPAHPDVELTLDPSLPAEEYHRRYTERFGR